MENSSATAASVLATLAFVYLMITCVVLAFIIFGLWLYWRIFEKAGYNGAMALLNLIPGVGHLICMIILAFGRWPIEDRLDLVRQQSPPTMPPPPPGSSIVQS
jgi:uncharacterized membrane protein YhaH (DUF805 family)